MNHKKCTEQELYYLSLSEIYLAELEDMQKPITEIMKAKGVMVEIESDLLKFLSKNKPTEASKRQSERISILSSVIDYFSSVASTNYQLKLSLREANRQLKKEKEDHSSTTRALEVATNILNEP